MRCKTSTFTQIVAVTCAATTACFDPGGGSRPSEWKGFDGPPPSLVDGLGWSQPNDIVPADEVGTLPGEMSVSDIGKPQYTIPLRVPEGRNGVQPSLAISFGGGTSNGLLGVGWQLGGLSRIAPCRRSVSRDGAPAAVGFRAGDAYCLDGVRLVPESGAPGDHGTLHRTEEDRFVRIESLGALGGGEFTVPERWIAHHPGGERWIYSRRLTAPQVHYTDPAGGGPAVREVVWSWALERVEDRLGNAMTIEYEEIAPAASAGPLPYADQFALEFYPRRIRYTSHDSGLPAQRDIELFYEDRPDPIDTYISGVHVHLGKRLRAIEMRAPNPEAIETVWYYELSYQTSKHTGRSLLSELRLCDGTKHCLPPTRMSWTEGYDAYVRTETGISLPDTFRLTNLIPGDFDGDGLGDVLYWQGNRATCLCADSACTEVTYGGSPYGPPCLEVGTFAVEGEWRIGYGDGHGGFSRTEATGLRTSFATREHHVAHAGSADPDEYNPPIVADFDGDGADDLLAARTGEIRSPSRGYALLQDISSTFQGLPPHWEPDVRYLADLDGDGRIDLFTNTNRPTPNIHWTPEGGEVHGWSGPHEWHEYQWAFRLGSGEPGFGIERAAGVTPYMSRYDVDLAWHSVDPRRLGLAMDLEGDGRTELLLPQPLNRYATLKASHDGTPIVGETNLTYLWPLVGGVSQAGPYSPVYLDINGDGLRDVISVNGVRVDSTGELQLPARINTGSGFGPWYLASVDAYLPPEEQRDPIELAASTSALGDTDAPDSNQIPLSPMVDDGVRVFDFNGDGRQDFLVPTASGPIIYVSDGRRFRRHDATFPLTAPVSWALPDGRWRFLGWTHRFLDLDGNGLADLVQYDQAADRIVTWRQAGRMPDQLARVTNGLGRIESVVMRPLSDRKIYTPGAGCAYPQRCARAGGYVVALLERTNAANELDHHFYEYHDARFDVTGRGFLGFGRRQVQHSELGTRTTFEYDHHTREHAAYPYAGRVAHARTEQPLGDGRTLVETETTTHRSWWRLGNRAHFVRPESTVRRTFELDGPVPPTLSAAQARRVEEIERAWDNYGYLEREKRRRHGGIVPEGGGPAILVEGERITHETEWEHRPEAWLLGLRRRVRATSEAPGPLAGTATRETHFVPDEHGRTVQVIIEPGDPSATLQTTLHYGSFGELVKVVKESSPSHPLTGHEVRTETFAYDAEFLYPQEYVNPLGHRTEVQVHPALGLPIRAKDANGFRIRTTYDAFGRERWTGHAGGFQVWTRFERGDVGPYRTRVRSSDGAEHTSEYNAAGAPFKFTEKAFDGAWVVTEQRYDYQGNLAEQSNAFVDFADRRWTTYEHDGLGRLLRANYADGTHIRHQYTLDEQRTWDRRGNESYLRRDVDGNVVVSANVLTDSGGSPLARTRYAYGPFGKLARVIDANGHTRTTTYDPRGRMTALSDPDLGLRRLLYNAFGEVIEEEDPVGRAAGIPTRYERDALGRVRARSAVDGDQKHWWDEPVDGAGTPWAGVRHGSVSADGVETRAEYDAYGRLARHRTFVDGEWHDVEYAYDGASRLDEIRYPSTPGGSEFAIRFTFGANGALAAIVDKATGKPLWRAVGRDATGRMTEAELGPNLRTSRRFDPATGRLEQVWSEAYAPLSATWDRIFELGYGYDENGNVRTRVDPVQSRDESFAYDSLDRLTSWTRKAGKHPSYRTDYRYDLLGNLVQRALTGSGAEVVEHFDLGAEGGPNALSRYRRVDAGVVVADTGMAYDDNGRRIKGPWNEVVYGSTDLPRRIEADEGTTIFAYTADDDRVLEKTADRTTVRVAQLYERRTFADDIEHVFMIPSDEGMVAQVVYREAAGTTETYYLHQDRLGSASLVTDAAGAVVERQWFTPYGDRVTPEGLPAYGGAAGAALGDDFTGHRRAGNTGLVDMNGRFYDPIGARFLSPDPVVAYPYFGQSLNRYAYVLGNPLKYRDPSGFVPEWDESIGMYVELGVVVDNAYVDMSFTRPEQLTAAERTSFGADSLDDTGPPPPSPGDEADRRGDGPGREVTSRVERLRWDIYAHTFNPVWDEENRRTVYRLGERRIGAVTISFTYSRDSDGHREAWFDPRTDVDVELAPTPVAPRISVDGAVRRIGAVPEVNFTITVESARGTVSSGRTTTTGSPTAQLQAGNDAARMTTTSPSVTNAETTSRSAATGNSYTATGRIQIPLTPGLGPQLLRAPTLPRNAAVSYEDPDLARVLSTSPTAGIRLRYVSWTVESTQRHAAPSN